MTVVEITTEETAGKITMPTTGENADKIIMVAIVVETIEEIAVREIMHEMAKEYLSVLKKLKVVLMESNKNRKIPESAIRNLLIRELIRNQPKKK